MVEGRVCHLRMGVDKAMSNASDASLKKRRIESVLESLVRGTSFLKACKAIDINQATF